MPRLLGAGDPPHDEESERREERVCDCDARVAAGLHDAKVEGREQVGDHLDAEHDGGVPELAAAAPRRGRRVREHAGLHGDWSGRRRLLNGLRGHGAHI